MVLKLCCTVIVFIAVFICTSVAYKSPSHAFSTSTSAPIGGLFNNETMENSLTAFKKIAPEGDTKTYYGRLLAPKVLDTYSTALELCDFTSDNRGIVALVDARPTYGICDIVCLLCNKYKIPYLSAGWESIDSLAENTFTFMYHPPPEIISKGYTALTKHLGYDKFTIFYEDDGSFIRLQDVINSWSNDKDQYIIFSKLDPNGDNRETFKNIFKVEHMSYHILDCNVDNILKYFEEITQIDVATKYQSFILSNLDAYTVPLHKVPALLANVSTLHLTTAESEDRWRDFGMTTYKKKLLETALTADALNHLERAIKAMISSEKGKSNKELHNPPALCYQNNKRDYEELVWPLGDKLRDALLKTKAYGFTGNIEFDEEIGKRKDFELHYSKLNQDSKFVHVGTWSSKTNILNTSETNVLDRSSNLQENNVIRVITKVGPPYVYVNTTEDGSTKLIGYAIELIENIFQVIREKKKGNENLQYEIRREDKDDYGSQIEGSKKWSGIIGELIEHKADMAVCDLTITSDRNAVVDFSIPFMTLGISMLMRERDAEPPKMFSFLLPLSLDVWLYLATTYIIVSFVLLICARMSQDDWVNPHPCNQNPENLQNIWSFYNCMWLTMGAIMCQGCDILPRAVGSRWIAGMWWFFALIVTSSYTANLSTFLSEGRRNDDIKDVKDLASQNKVSYGAVNNASTYKFFENSNDTTYAKLWSVMSTAKPTVFTSKNEEGMDRVKRSKGNYAFFMESTAIEYYIKRHCELKMVGSNLDSKEYGIAFPKSSTLKGHVDFAILHLQEQGVLEALKQKWWEQEFNDGKCKEKQKEEDDSGSLQMKNTSGIFLVLGLGGILGLIVAIIDFILNAQQISVKERVSFREALLSEWRASLDPRALQKLAAPPRSAPPSTASPSPQRERSQSRAVSVLRAASSFINFDEIY